ncbi:bifunctional DNA-formamidopyrimidine glycosylase/DNA-(apurinic or apyrimidinic site) lyase [Georgenia sp. MJ173]|uniref:bifunctional DNA-formamidopyrimidine glycosylase/DNA-(apurinic or apyrimidinic site) lyase n=1 Tax=Georgenia sunbinii TaxID=3117728 RepID=UPI002F26B9E0
MPECPEVETVREGIERHVVGRRITGAQVHHPRAVRRHVGGALDLPGRVVGTTVSAAVRRGKYLWLLLEHDADAAADGPTEALLVHLGMSGQLLVRHEGAGPAVVADLGVDPEHPSTRHLRADLALDDGTALWFVDQRTFGHLLVADLVVTPDGGPGGVGSPLPLLPEPAAHIARDPLDPALDLDALVRRLRTKRTEIKRALLDQTLVSGIGNIYADEALWRARLHPRRATDRLSRQAATEVLTAAEDVMRDALAAGGTSFDGLYVDVDGASGYFERSLDAYGRAGEPCHRCGTPMVRESFTNRSSTFCPRCQRAPRG